MSGFVCILHHDEGPVDRPLLEGMTSYLAAACGPDETGVWSKGPVGLGHALLRTGSPAGERQPSSLDSNVWIAADARIDGRAALVEQLAASGRIAKPDAPDAELILHAYHTWGEDCLEHLIGDFAFAIWDGPRRTLFCARDQFGVVPLFYAETPGALIVSNLLNCVRLHPAISDRLNEEAIADYLLVHMNMTPDTTTFSDIRRLPAAHALNCVGGALRIRRYWDLHDGEKHVRYRRPAEHVERFGALFDQAVGDRLRDCQAGTQLSGGMDSSSIAVTAKKILAQRGGEIDLRAYTIVYRWLIQEQEGTYATEVANGAGIPVEQLEAEHFLTQPPEAAPGWVSPEPSVITNQTAEHEILRRVSRYGRTMFTGFGGDPLFAYARPPFETSLRRGRLDEVARDSWRSFMLFGSLPRPGIRTAIRGWFRKPPVFNGLPRWIDPDFARRVNLEDRVRQFLEKGRDLSGLRTMVNPRWSNLFGWMHPGFHGVPVRVVMPFFDVRLATHVATVPPLPWRAGKRLLREAMQGRLPETVRQRPKTMLHQRNLRPNREDPWYKLATQPGQQERHRELLAVQDMARFVDIKRLSSSLASPLAEGNSALGSCLPLAYWLRHRQRPTLSARFEGEPSHGTR